MLHAGILLNKPYNNQRELNKSFNLVQILDRANVILFILLKPKLLSVALFHFEGFLSQIQCLCSNSKLGPDRLEGETLGFLSI